MIDYQERSHVEQLILNATYQNKGRLWKDLHNSFNKVLDFIADRSGGVNIYDITIYHMYPTLLVGEYFNNPDVISLFGLNPGIRFGDQASNVYEALFEDFMKPEVSLIE